MEVGIFILIVAFIVVGIIGAFLYATAARLRQKKLDPRGDQVERSTQREGGSRPRHVEVDNEQRSRFVGTR